MGVYFWLGNKDHIPLQNGPPWSGLIKEKVGHTSWILLRVSSGTVGPTSTSGTLRQSQPQEPAHVSWRAFPPRVPHAQMRPTYRSLMNDMGRGKTTTVIEISLSLPKWNIHHLLRYFNSSLLWLECLYVGLTGHSMVYTVVWSHVETCDQVHTTTADRGFSKGKLKNPNKNRKKNLLWIPDVSICKGHIHGHMYRIGFKFLK